MSSLEKDAIRAWLELLTATGAMKKDIDAIMRREFGHSLSRFDVLSALERAGPNGLRASQLSEFLLVTDGATTQITAPLIREGLVKRTPCPDDRRSAFFALSAKGANLFAKMAGRHRRWVTNRFSNLSANQLQTMRNLVQKIDLPDRALIDERKAI